MKAFLSHSSKDKWLVEKTAELLGFARCEYDAYTFDHILNSQAIRKALSRSGLFVFFLSKDSINSNFVSEELRTALDFRAQGSVRRVLIITLDDTSYKALPEWMQHINVVSKLSSPPTCARKIEAELLSLEAESEKVTEVYVPREADEAALRAALKKAPGKAPIAIHAVGYHGIGRRTFLRRSLHSLFPRQIRSFVPVTVGKYDGINEFYRQLYDNFKVSSLSEKLSDFEKFAQSSYEEQVEQLADMFAFVFDSDEIILVDDKGAVYTDEGEYQPFLGDLIEKLKSSPRPLLAIVQTRMMPLRIREDHNSSYHTFIRPFDDEKVSEILSFTLREIDVDFSEEQLAALCSLQDGNPINIKLTMKAIKSYGLESFIDDPSLLVDWKRKRSEDFLSKIEFSSLELDLVALLSDYRIMPFSLLKRSVADGGWSLQDLTLALRKLEDYCCIERVGPLYSISLAVHDAVGRDRRFKRADRWRSDVANRILNEIAEYTNDESISVPILAAGARASIIGGKLDNIAASFILPSHFLLLAREAYHDDRWRAALDLCKKAYSLRSQLSTDGCIEALRLWGLSAIRMNNEGELKFSLAELDQYKSKRIAERNIYFLQGFQSRLGKRYDEAEQFFLKAHKLAKGNLSINRELASLYRHRGQYSEAESYARSAYDRIPTNPFVIDVLLESLLGKASLGLPVQEVEISRLFDELKKYGDVPGSSFYETRRAQALLKSKLTREALAAADKALQRTPTFLPGRFLRADIRLALSDARGAREDLNEINKILERRGGFSEEDEGRTVELEIKILIGDSQYKLAKDKLFTSQFLPAVARKRLTRTLVSAINFNPAAADAATLRWAQKFS